VARNFQIERYHRQRAYPDGIRAEDSGLTAMKIRPAAGIHHDANPNPCCKTHDRDELMLVGLNRYSKCTYDSEGQTQRARTDPGRV
jgi:hypothetical protein